MDQACSFCLSAVNDPLNLGEKYLIIGTAAHTHCNLLAADPAVWISSPTTAIEKVASAANIKCYYCKKGGATIKCVKCKIRFHLPCGLANGSLSQFKGVYPSYCAAHKPKQMVPQKFMAIAKSTTQNCAICFDDIDLSDTESWIWPPCCRKSFFHRSCVQKMAFHQKNLTKCCMCRNVTKFKNCIIKFGIHVPKWSITSWSVQFPFQMAADVRCDAEECFCPYGRETFKPVTIWERGKCRTCNFNTHYRCSDLLTDLLFHCQNCVARLYNVV